jgi:hypothetical protein
VTERLFDIGKPHVRPPRCETGVLPEEMRRFMAQRTAEVSQRRAIFDTAVAKPAP